MNGGYEKLIWIRDSDDREYACYADDFKPERTSGEKSNDDWVARCFDVNRLVSTGR